MRALIAIIVLAATAAFAAKAKLAPPSKLSLVQAQCGRCTCAGDTDCGADGACTAGLCTAGETARVSCSVAADCAAGQGCGPFPHLCSATFALASGTATIKGAREPAPTCPKTGAPTESPSGDVRLVGVTQSGAAYTGKLSAAVVLKTSFGADPNGTCVLAGTQLELEGLTGEVDCRAGKCRGTLYPFACLPKECADTPITSEVSHFVVRDPAGATLAAPGILLLPASGDAQ